MLCLQDRVETSPEQMAACTALAESLTTSTGLFTRVVGWYHSHPHITVLPSHVDVSTQVRHTVRPGAECTGRQGRGQAGRLGKQAEVQTCRREICRQTRRGKAALTGSPVQVVT